MNTKAEDTGRRTNIEFKARCSDLPRIRQAIKSLDHRYVGEDNQIDTYFRVPKGRLKLRQGNIETKLIYYSRPDGTAPKQSDVQLYAAPDPEILLRLLTTAMGIDVRVVKRREIYFVDNVKLHLDNVEELGTFVEAEAIDADGTRGVEELKQQCDYFLSLFKISPDDLVATSYSDLLRSLND